MVITVIGCKRGLGTLMEPNQVHQWLLLMRAVCGLRVQGLLNSSYSEATAEAAYMFILGFLGHLVGNYGGQNAGLDGAVCPIQQVGSYVSKLYVVVAIGWKNITLLYSMPLNC